MLVRHRYPTRSFDVNLDRAFDQLTRSLFDGRPSSSGTDNPTVRGAWNGDDYQITVDLPGIPADAVSVEVSGTALQLAARTDNFQWDSTLRLGSGLDPESVTARHLDGRLTVTVSKLAEPAARQVAIDTTPAPAELESADTGDDRADGGDGQSSDTNSAG